MIYLDNGATTFPKPEVVYQAMDIFARTGAVNAGRGAYAAARAADQMIKNVRTGLISLMDAREQAQGGAHPIGDYRTEPDHLRSGLDREIHRLCLAL